MLGLAAALGLALAACSGSSSDGTADRAAGSTTTGSPTTATTTPVRASAGCGTKPAVTAPKQDRPGDVPLTFDANGTERTYRLAIPKAYDPDVPAPLILNLHGSGSNAVQQSVYSDLPRRGGAQGYVVVTPDAIAANWQLTATGTDDEFLNALVDDVEANYCIDLDRVHAAGMSLGAWKTGLEGCQHPDRFASIALVTVEVHPNDCGPTAVVAFHGTADRTVPYGEGGEPGIEVRGRNGGLPGARHNIAQWAEAAGCDPDPHIERIGDDVEHRTYGGCDAGTGVELYTIEGGGHTWPGAEITIGPTTQTIDATDIALAWFAAHPMRR
jgi:polyhydroxybutyrate depolymerase